MAGIGVKLSKIYEKKSIFAHIVGFTYSTVVTVAPMILVILAILFLGKIVGYSTVGYNERELFSCTVLYIFIFSLLIASPFNAIFSRYMSDVIYLEHYDDILPCYYTGMMIEIGLSGIIGIAFCICEYVIGGVDPVFVFLGFAGFLSLAFVFYTMLYLSICKDYGKITLFYFIGMLSMMILGWVFVKILGMAVTTGMLLALDIGLLLIGVMEFALIRNYFRGNSRNYFTVLSYFRRYWLLIVSNFLYVAGLYVHNFVFWTTDLRIVAAKVFVCAEPYDMATFLALVTNVTSTMLFISNIEQRFHGRYRKFSEMLSGGRLRDVENAKGRMFRQLSSELMSQVRVQFIISAVLFLLFLVILPTFGFSGIVMQIYPCLAAGYFVLFVMYSLIIFLYYFNDNEGAVLTCASFFISTLLLSVVATHLPIIWYGAGLFAGSVIGWIVAYIRIRWVEKHIDEHIFCNGTLLKPGHGQKPGSRVYVRRSGTIS